MADLVSADSKESIKADKSSTEPADLSVYHGDQDWTDAEEAAVRRKFDLVVTPVCTILYLCCAIDRWVFPKSLSMSPF